MLDQILGKFLTPLKTQQLLFNVYAPVVYLANSIGDGSRLCSDSSEVEKGTSSEAVEICLADICRRFSLKFLKQG